MFFAWFCNMAMHIGMSDLSIFRYAKRPQMGLSSAAGMYLGHYMAWIAAGLLYAVQLDRDPNNINVAPGPMAYNIAGITGVLCVIIAGWTTANPTIYRAGLAFQGIRPQWSRARVTIVAGVVCTIIGVFPAIAMKLLDFVALYGLVLMPMGAVILVDHYFMAKLNMLEGYAEQARIGFNWAAGLTWFVTLALCLVLNLLFGIEIFFLGLPGWFIAAILYIVLSKMMQSKTVSQGALS
jgi:purine-cytosine permease-like protein